MSGREIHVDHLARLSPANLEALIWGPLMAAALRQRGELVLHAGAAVNDRGAVVVAGGPVCGKSEVLAGLRYRGWAVAADDLTPIWMTQQGPVAGTGRALLEVWRETATRWGLSLPGTADGLKACVVETAQPVRDHHPLRAVVVIEMHNGAIDASRIENTEALAALVGQQVGGSREVVAAEHGRRRLELLAAMASIPVFRVKHARRRTDAFPLVKAVAELLETV